MTARLQHVTVLSDDIDATRDFYREVVGLAPGPRPTFEFAGHWLYSGEVACVHIAERASYRPHAARLGLSVAEGTARADQIDHIAFEAGDYEAALAALASRGIEAIANAVPGGPRQLFFNDPNGVRVELCFAPAPD
jgi:catechol 2,3-dioxygenase-like lactoylglutathione lyase family enzyme